MTKQPRRLLVASAVRIKLDADRARTKRAQRAETWQTEAWDYYDVVPEAKFAANFVANMLAKLVVYAAAIPPDGPSDAEPVPIEEPESSISPELARAAQAEIERLRGETGGQSEIIRTAVLNLDVAAECYLVGFGERIGVDGEIDEAEHWEIRSVSEVEVAPSGAYKVKGNPDGKARILDPELDTCIRIYQRHPRWSDKADCNMRGVLGECEALVVLSNQLVAESRSRAPAGILCVPNDLTIDGIDPTEGETDESDGFMKELTDALTEPIADPTSASSVVPLLVRGQAESLKPDAFRHFTLSRQADSSLDSRIQARVERFARGINLPVEVVMGHQQTTFANAAQIDEDTFEKYLEPRALLLVDALTVAFLRPNLIDAGFDPDDVDRVVCWFDPTELIGPPELSQAADDAYDRYVLSGESYRRAKGFTEDDAPSAEELLERVGLRRGILTAELTRALLELLGIDIDVEQFPEPESTTESSNGNTTASARAVLRALRTPAIAASSRPVLVANTQRQPGERLMAIDRELRTRLITSADRTMTRAIERAGNRLKARRRDGLDERLRTVSPFAAAAHLGRDAVLAAGLSDDELLEGAFDSMEDQFMSWGRRAQRDAFALVERFVGGFSRTERDSLGLRQASSLREAWVWMREALTSLAVSRLYNPDPLAPDLGEFDSSTKVPPGLVRQAIARAGGATQIYTSGSGDAWLALDASGTRPLGGIGTGELINETLTEHGARREGWQWDYGPAFRQRPFLPHQQLDGITFDNFDAAVLANVETWPDLPFYAPGDHDGCQCDVTPIILEPE